jgi:hypothetical protein
MAAQEVLAIQDLLAAAMETTAAMADREGMEVQVILADMA